MKTVSVLALLALVAKTAHSQGSSPSITTPAAYTQCQPVSLTIAGGVAPYFLAVLPGGQASAAPIENLASAAAAGNYVWNVNLPAGTNITIRITDSQGNVNYNSARVIQASGDNSCLGTTASTSGTTAAGAGTSTASTGSSSMPPTTTTVSTGGASTTLTSAGPSATVTASTGPVPTNVTTNNGTTVSPSTYNFTCPQGMLTYGITTAVFGASSLTKATSYFGNWVGAAPGPLAGSSGSGIGSTRSYRLGANITIAETLRTNQTNTTTGALHQQWNFTQAGPITLSSGANGLVIYNAFDDLTVYTNATNNATSVQYFILACFNDQNLGLSALAQIIQISITQWSANLSSPATPTGTSRPPAKRRLLDLY